jgi:hypothetical protein
LAFVPDGDADGDAEKASETRVSVVAGATPVLSHPTRKRAAARNRAIVPLAKGCDEKGRAGKNREVSVFMAAEETVGKDWVSEGFRYTLLRPPKEPKIDRTLSPLPSTLSKTRTTSSNLCGFCPPDL